MDDRDVAEKMAAQAKYGGGLTGAAGTTNACEAQQPMRETLTGRFRSQLSRAQRESRKENQLAELLYLLDKNPEVARILDLIDSLGDR